MTDPGHHPRLRIEVHRAHVEGDRVTFAWEQSAPNPHQLRNQWFMRYPGLELTGFAPELLLEVFLALQLKVWAAHPGRVEIRLPVAMPQWSVAFWADYHRATNLAILPLAENRPRDPWPGGASGLHPTYDHIVFFGGGKDSGTAASLLEEIGGPGSTLLLSAIAPLEPGAGAERLVQRRIVEFIHQPVSAATGLPTAVFHSDYSSNVRPGKAHPQPFLEFYHAGTLPILIAHDVRLTSVGHARNDYFALAAPGSTPPPHRWSGRPETLAAISAHYRRSWGLDIMPMSLVSPLSVNATFVFISQRYPAMNASFVSCPHTRAPWCHSCVKCLRNLFGTLSAGVPQARFDYDRMLRSPLVAELMTAIRAHDRQTGRYLMHPNMFKNWSSLVERMSQIAMIRPATLDRVLAPVTRRIFDELRDHYDGPLHPPSLQIPRAAIALLPPSMRTPITDILGAHFELIDDLADVPFPDGTTLMPSWHVPLTLAREVERLVPDWARPAGLTTN